MSWGNEDEGGCPYSWDYMSLFSCNGENFLIAFDSDDTPTNSLTWHSLFLRIECLYSFGDTGDGANNYTTYWGKGKNLKQLLFS